MVVSGLIGIMGKETEKNSLLYYMLIYQKGSF